MKEKKKKRRKGKRNHNSPRKTFDKRQKNTQGIQKIKKGLECKSRDGKCAKILCEMHKRYEEEKKHIFSMETFGMKSENQNVGELTKREICIASKRNPFVVRD